MLRIEAYFHAVAVAPLLLRLVDVFLEFGEVADAFGFHIAPFSLSTAIDFCNQYKIKY